MGNSPKSFGAQVGVEFGVAGLDCKFIGELGVSDGKTQVVAAARNIDIKQILNKFEIDLADLPEELKGLNILIDTLYLAIDIDEKLGIVGIQESSKEFFCKVNLQKERIVRRFYENTIKQLLRIST